MALFAGSVKSLPQLGDALGGIQKTQGNNLSKVFDRVRSRFQSEGNPKSDYFDQRMGVAQDFANRGLESSLEGVLGDASYKDALSERDHGQNMQLVQRIGALNKPSTLEEVLMGLSGAAGVAGQFAPLYKSLSNRTPNYVPSYGSARNPYADALDIFRGYEEDPNELRLY